MKNLFRSTCMALVLGCAVQAYAQDNGVERTAKKVGHTTSRVAKKTAHKTSELASKGASAVADQRYKGKCAPNGEDVYIDGKARYYYVDKKGHHVFLKKSQIRDKHDMKM
ncbi:hypothetical protein MUY27_19575 [Mucilaginibacter sp. RS28]|uniref:Uncharacterized protein n=1 Tax=Mucilaginibacter straminoryzae TaxID=2932774 RepID=A0A9X1X6R5_9SPHI|nr:hypothetical protein [Mucilaginibacter straminoryzae]MCJ8211928.1 hypothetical protein [Mucilaginibacter straminoryzae]